MIETKKFGKKKIGFMIIALVLAILMIIPMVSVFAEDIPELDPSVYKNNEDKHKCYGESEREGGYHLGDNVPQDIIKKAIDAVNQAPSKGGMIGIQYPHGVDGYDCSDFIEIFLRDYLGFNNTGDLSADAVPIYSVKGKTADEFYKALDAADTGETFEVSKKDMYDSNGDPTPSKAEAAMVKAGMLPGALLFYLDPDEPNSDKKTHVALYIGEGKVIESVGGKTGTEGIRERDFRVDVYGKNDPNKGGLYTFKNLTTIQNGKLQIIKYSNNKDITDDNGCYSLEKAKFNVYNKDGDIVDTVVTDEEGKATTKDLPEGKNYYIKEAEAPKGFVLDTSAIKNLEIIADKTTKVKVPNTAGNDPIDMLVQKVDAVTGKPVAVGDGSLAGAQFTVKYYDTHGKTVEELAALTPKRTWVFETNDKGVCLLTNKVAGDALYTDSDGKPCVPFGMITIQETKAPAGYVIDNTVSKFDFTVPDEITDETVEAFNTKEVKETSIYGDVTIAKFDIDIKDSQKAQGDATLAGTQFEIVNRSKAAVTLKDKSTYAVGAVVTTITAGADGIAKTTGQFLPYGTYEVREKVDGAPEGYKHEGVLSRTFSIRTDGQNEQLTAYDKAIQNKVIRGDVVINKLDNETKLAQAQGGATLYKATFEIINRSKAEVLSADGKTKYPVGSVVATIETDENGEAKTEGGTLAYGTYEIRETKAPEGYKHTGTLTRTFTVREETPVDLRSADKGILNDVKRGDLAGVKVEADTFKRLANIPFEIKSNTTGEAHTIVTDSNGQFDTSSDWNPHSQNTNRGETDEDGIWFNGYNNEETGAKVNDELGALPYDTYTVTELECENNVGKTMISFEVTIERDKMKVNLGTVINDIGDKPEIGTTATGDEGQKELAMGESVTLVDTVAYSGLTVGKEYVLNGTLMDKETNAPLKDAEGKEIVASTTFTPETEVGAVEVTFVFDTSTLGTGKELVVFESLSKDGTEVAVHTDIEDEGQTVKVEGPELKTTASDENGEKEIGASASVKVIDIVQYTNLVPGKEYTLTGTLMDKETGEKLMVDGQEVTSTEKFVPESANGSYTMTFELNASALVGKTTVVFENLYSGQKEIAVHADINDEGQTVKFEEPHIKTTASGENGEKEISVGSSVTVVDIVEYNALIPGKEYTVTGTLMDKATGEEMLVNGEKVTATETFTPDKASGSIEMKFTFDASGLAGKETVVFEHIYNEGLEVGAHADINDEGQTVKFKTPEVKTTATGENGEKDIETSASVTVIDTVKYTNLHVGNEYTVNGELMDKSTGESFTVNGKKVTATATFTPTEENGEVQLSFTFDASGMAGRSVVVFEHLFSGDVEIATHADINDEGQTVNLKDYPTIIQTGYDNNMAIFIGIAALACVAIVLAAIRAKKKGIFTK